MIICINPNCIASHQPVEYAGRKCPNCGSDLMLQNRYRVTSIIRINRGFGNVYEVEDRGKTKILKVLNQIHGKDRRAIQLFRQEVKVLSHFDHPGIPKCDSYFQYELNEGERLHCIVMEKIDGCNLEEWVEKNQPISAEQGLEWLEKITSILKVVHEQKYLHRDIKPHNIMRKDNGQFVLIDFGAAIRINLFYKTYAITIYSAMLLLGKGDETDGYTAPEQNRHYCTPQTDIFALGKSFVFLLTGKFPRDKAMYNEKTEKINWRKYAKGVSDEFANIIEKAIEHDPKKRYNNTQEILNDIGRIKKIVELI
ncbi:serine/threonine-protein kinase [Microcoleus sp. D3_18_C4]|uniref:serine/threonine-protein kinase n=2 Tax=unclassified Microcoleus TaxID=2642155 RepID=UPI002FD742AF